MANTAPTRFHSGIRHPKENGATQPVCESVRSANEEFERRTAEHLEICLGVLIEQRDAALEKLEAAEGEARRWREDIEAEHRRVIESMVQHHQAEVDNLKSQVESLKESCRILDAKGRASSEPAPRDELEEQLGVIRAEMLEIQSERDKALAAVDDVRLGLLSELEAARDEAIDLQARLDEAERLVEQVRDEADVEIFQLKEDVHELRRLLDESQRITT